MVGRLPPFARSVVVESFSGDLDTGDGEVLYQAIEKMQETLLYTSLGLDHADHVRYRQVAGRVAFMVGGSAHHTGMKQNLDANDAEFVVAHCIDTVVQLEGLVGDIDAPFGVKHW